MVPFGPSILHGKYNFWDKKMSRKGQDAVIQAFFFFPFFVLLSFLLLIPLPCHIWFKYHLANCVTSRTFLRNQPCDIWNQSQPEGGVGSQKRRETIRKDPVLCMVSPFHFMSFEVYWGLKIPPPARYRLSSISTARR